MHKGHEHGIVIVILAVTLATAAADVPAAAGEPTGFIRPAERDKCPVCGMFVAKYPDWVAEVLFKDGSYAVFDGVKDLMKYWFDMAAYGKGRQRPEISVIIVTDYYQVSPIDGRAAFFVLSGHPNRPPATVSRDCENDSENGLCRREGRGGSLYLQEMRPPESSL